MSGPRDDPNLLKPFIPTGPAVERDRAVKEGHRPMTDQPAPISPDDAADVAVSRPRGSNADEWHLFLSENTDALPFVAVQIAEAIDALERKVEALKSALAPTPPASPPASSDAPDR